MNHENNINLICNEKIRLDRFISKNIPKDFLISRNKIEKIIKENGVMVNDEIVKKTSFSLKESYKISFYLNIKTEEESKRNNKEIKTNLDIHIIFEDEDILVINKPASITTHRAISEKNFTVVDWLEEHNFTLSNINDNDRKGIVHRLDKPTTGVMVIAKNNISHVNLSKQLQERNMGRYYLAIINPLLKENCIVDKPLGRSKNNRLLMTTHRPVKSRDAKTQFIQLSPSIDLKTQLICAKLFTGRTHQIRAHLKYLQRHILGDKAYGYREKWEEETHIYLHAYLLYLAHPKTNEQMLFVADLDNRMKHFLEKNFYMDKINEDINSDNIIKLFNTPI